MDGQRVESWSTANANTPLEATTYWNGRPIAMFSGGQIVFQHQDLTGTERLRTDANGNPFTCLASLPFGDGSGTSGTDSDPHHFADLDHDNESGTDHATFRQYSSMTGRWMSPDPYDGSMDLGSPQTLNHYSYVGNMPFKYTDPTGLFGEEIYTISLWAFGAGGEVDPVQDIIGGTLLAVDAAANIVFRKSVCSLSVHILSCLQAVCEAMYRQLRETRPKSQ